jgi:hypothetical protein
LAPDIYTVAVPLTSKRGMHVVLLARLKLSVNLCQFVVTKKLTAAFPATEIKNNSPPTVPEAVLAQQENTYVTLAVVDNCNGYSVQPSPTVDVNWTTESWIPGGGFMLVFKERVTPVVLIPATKRAVCIKFVFAGVEGAKMIEEPMALSTRTEPFDTCNACCGLVVPMPTLPLLRNVMTVTSVV